MSLLESKLKDLLSVDDAENIDESIYQEILKQEMPEEDTSKISNIFLHVDLKEVTAEKVNFVYNFFQKNERVSEVNTDLIININGNIPTVAEVENKLRQIPRYNSISWKKPVGVEQEVIVDVDLKDINILKETIISNKEFIKINLKDEVANQLLYKNLETSLLINQSYENKDSALDLANKTIEIASDRAGLTGQSKKILIENFTNSKPIGLTFASTDYRSGNQNLSNVIDDNINFNLTINRKLTESIVKLGSNLQENIFQNEFKGMIPAAENITKKYVENYQNSVVENNSETEFMLIIDENYLYDNTVVDFNAENADIDNFSIKLVGYKIEKYELLPDGGIERYKDIFFNSYFFSSFNDIKVKYGSKYRYIIKAIYKVNKNFIGITTTDLPIVLNANFYVESEGKSISAECIELIPPQPPESFHISFDYKNKLPILRWNFPSNPQQDIKKFQIFKRNNVSEPFTVLAEYDFDDSDVKTTQILEEILPQNKYLLNRPKKIYTDYRFNISNSPIYALASVDAHGMTSNLSKQLQFTYNKRKNTISVKLISIGGAPKHYPNIYINRDTFVDIMKSSGKNRMNVFFNPEYYQVFKNNIDENNQTEIINEKNLNLIAANAIKPTYSIQILNIDNQKDQIINIRVKDESSNYDSIAPDVSSSPDDYLF